MDKNTDVVVVVVDDDMIDRRSIERALRERHIPNPIAEARNGIEALKVLRSLLPTQEALVILDINMPLMDGHEFLREIRADAQLKKTVVFVLTTSDQKSDQLKAYDQQAAGYLIKKGQDGSFDQIMDLLDRYLRTVDFPRLALTP